MLRNVDIIANSLQTTLPNMEGASDDSKANAIEGHEKNLANYSFQTKAQILQTTHVALTKTTTNSSQATTADKGQETVTIRYSFEKRKHGTTLDGKNEKKGSLSKVMCQTKTIPNSNEDTSQG
jgi:hypothetical protein